MRMNPSCHSERITHPDLFKLFILAILMWPRFHDIWRLGIVPGDVEYEVSPAVVKEVNPFDHSASSATI